MALFTLVINGEDFSGYIQQRTDIKEQMVRITGSAQGVAVDGTTIADLVKIKWNPSFLLQPMPKAKLQRLIDMMQLETVELEYTSVASDELRQIQAVPVSMTVNFATMSYGRYIYDATPISFEEV